jgi:hypothetical protein
MAIVPISGVLAALLLVIGSRSYPADRTAADHGIRVETLDTVPQTA